MTIISFPTNQYTHNTHVHGVLLVSCFYTCITRVLNVSLGVELVSRTPILDVYLYMCYTRWNLVSLRCHGSGGWCKMGAMTRVIHVLFHTCNVRVFGVCMDTRRCMFHVCYTCITRDMIHVWYTSPLRFNVVAHACTSYQHSVSDGYKGVTYAATVHSCTLQRRPPVCSSALSNSRLKMAYAWRHCRLH